MPVTKIEVKSRVPFAQGREFGDVGSYEQLDGAVHFAVDPEHPANETVADLNLAPRNEQGQVTFSSDFRILRPVDPARGNRRLLLDVLNRGKALALRNINSAPEVAPDAPPNAGNGFLMREGYTVVWCGWQHDVPDAPGLLRINAPEARENGEPVSGTIVVTVQPHVPGQVQFLSDRLHRPYASNHLEDWNAVMTVQDHEDGPERVIPRQEWAFARLEGERKVPDTSHVYLESGFVPGKVYQVIYSTTGAPVVGLGHLATRDIAAFLRNGDAADGNPCAGEIDRAYAFGVSQSGRFLRQFLYMAVNFDQDGNTVFDGFIPHVAGAKRGEFNQRFGQPSSQASRSTNSLFPFSDTDQTDSETGLTDGLLTRLAAKGPLPKIMYVNTSSEYWAGHCALMHVDLEGKRDLELPDAVRVYLLAGTQHGLGSLPLTDNDADGYRTQQLVNCLDYRPLLRAALTNLDKWVTSGELPPASRYPRLDDGTAVTPETALTTIGSIPGVNSPAHLRRFTRLDFGPDPDVPTKIPAEVGRPFPTLVPVVDDNGNELAGITLPYISAPLATYTGWNLRHPDIGGADQVMSTGGASGGTLRGSTIPFPVTVEARSSAGDPRQSVEELYQSRDGYLERVEQDARSLIDEGYLLAEDVPTVLEQAGQLYDVFSARVPEAQAAND